MPLRRFADTQIVAKISGIALKEVIGLETDMKT